MSRNTDTGLPAGGNEGPADADAAASSPAEALGGVWEALDMLPRSAASPTLTSTTVEMAAVAVRGAGETRAQRAGSSRGWWMPGLVILGGLGLGLAAGRSTAPDPDIRALEYLPVIRHVAPLREAGSVGFLTAVAAKNYPAVRRFGPFGRPGEGRGADPPADTAPQGEPAPAESPVPPELEAAIAALEGEPLGRGVSADVLARRRAEVELLSGDERRHLADRVSEFMALSEVARYDVLQLARFLADTSDDNAAERKHLLAAAAVWHQYMALRDPAERSDVVDLPSEQRLESLDRFYARFQFRGQREWDSRRGFGGPRPAGEAPGPGGGGAGEAGEPPPGAPRPGGPGFRPGPPGRSAGPGAGGRPGTPPAPR